MPIPGGSRPLGALLADMSLVDGEPVPAGAVLQPMVEAEVALVLDRDLKPAFTMAVYQHVLPGMQRDAANTFARLVTRPATDGSPVMSVAGR